MQRAREAPGIYCAVGVPPAGVDQLTQHGDARLRREFYTRSHRADQRTMVRE